MTDFNPYQVLSVDPDADLKTIKKAYQSLARMYHPDKNKSPDAEAKFKRIKKAWDVLKDEDKRAYYDAFGEIKTGPDNVDIQACDAILKIYDQIIKSNDPDKLLAHLLQVDFVECVADVIRNNSREVTRNIVRLRKHVKVYERMIKRMKRKKRKKKKDENPDAGRNIFEDYCKESIRSASKLIRMEETNKAILKRSLEILNDYEDIEEMQTGMKTIVFTTTSTGGTGG